MAGSKDEGARRIEEAARAAVAGDRREKAGVEAILGVPI
jgi:hypothetical protein